MTLGHNLFIFGRSFHPTVARNLTKIYQMNKGSYLRIFSKVPNLVDTQVFQETADLIHVLTIFCLFLSIYIRSNKPKSGGGNKIIRKYYSFGGMTATEGSATGGCGAWIG